VVTASVVALALTAAALAVALTATASGRGDSRELSQRLIPAAASSVTLISLYNAQQSALRNYVTDGRSGTLAPYRAVTAQVQPEESRLAGLIRGYRTITLPLAATETAQRAWLTRVATPQLTAAARGDFTAAQAMQADVAHVRPYVRAIRSRGAALQTRITAAQQMTTGRLIDAQAWLLGRARRIVRRRRRLHGRRPRRGEHPSAQAVPGAAPGRGRGGPRAALDPHPGDRAGRAG
jgi:hypothetical protein